MTTDLTRIREKARRDPQTVFTDLYHHVYDIDNLRTSFHMLAANKAVGIDGVSKDDYGRDLEENLQRLSKKLAQMGYIPQPKLRKRIPKPGTDKTRPLGISALEDKIVEMAMRRVFEAIYEEAFESSSFGYRPGLNQHQCLDVIGKTIQQRRINHVVEADIKSFFDEVNHAWLMRFLGKRIGDERILRMVNRMLKAGIMEDGLVKPTEEGTPQGSILSPILSNIYLHYVLDLWFRLRVKKQCRGEAHYFRFADDFIALFQFKDDAEWYENSLGERLEGFNLKLAKEKTRRMEFGKFARENAYRRKEKPQEFTFLGLSHFCGKTRYGNFKVKRKTSRKKFMISIRRFTEWARSKARYMRIGDLMRTARIKVIGYLNYYAVTDNIRMCERYVKYIERILFKWINRKSQKSGYIWDTFKQALRDIKWPRVCIKKNINPFGYLANNR